ncbi:hypothetical protein ACJX0J_020159, partial [Zea mays]
KERVMANFFIESITTKEYYGEKNYRIREDNTWKRATKRMLQVREGKNTHSRLWISTLCYTLAWLPTPRYFEAYPYG